MISRLKKKREHFCSCFFLLISDFDICIIFGTYYIGIGKFLIWLQNLIKFI
jgi:hypothetical protein